MQNFNKIFPWIFVSLLIASSFGLMFYSSSQESAIMDELAHIPAGYGYVKYLDYRLNPEHPPLVKAIAALPLLFEKLNFPTDKSPWQSEVNGQWEAGTQFLYESGNNADQIVQTSRFGPMILALILILFIYIWSKELIGRWWALLPTFLFAMSPTVLAHGHYVTTDLGAALGIFISAYYFVKFLINSNKRNLVWAGLAFGIAQLMKFSAVLLIPFLGILAIIFSLFVLREKKFVSLIKYIFATGIIFIIGFILVYAVYLPFTLNYPIEKQKTDTEFILTSFAGGPARDATHSVAGGPARDATHSVAGGPARDVTHSVAGGSDDSLQSCKGMRCLADINIMMAQNKILRPLGEYMLGVLMVLQRSSGGNTSYFLGEVSAAGWWYYFPVIFILKEQIASLILIALAFILAVWRSAKSFKFQVLSFKIFRDYLATHFPEFSMMLFVVFYWAYSIKSPLNIGVRHILPTLPFIYILTASGIKRWFNNGKLNQRESFEAKIRNFKNDILKISIKGIFVGAIIVWYFAETLLVAPNFISYFNEFAGGTKNGYQYVTDSNYDWGQDLTKLKKFIASWEVENNAKIDKIAVEYFGGGSPTYYLGDKFEPWQSSKGNPADIGIHWFAVSINNLQGALGKLTSDQQRKPEDEYQWLQKIKNPYQPDYKAGTSIFIYKL
ncbi:MAG: glycosyltransferase family 39 protein [Spirochaetota bacterium]